MITEDLAALAALDSGGRPVCLEYTRTEEFTTASLRHPMTITVKLGARADGTLTAVHFHNISNTGAYGNHGGETLFAASAAVAIYRCPNKRFDAYAVYTNTVPSGALRGYGMTQPAFAVECAIDELAAALGIDALELRRRNIVRPGDALLATDAHPDDVSFTEDTLARCIDRVDRALREHREHSGGDDLGPDWLIGDGTASSIHETAPPTEHISEAWATLCDDGRYEIAVGTVEFGEGTSTAHVQIAASVLFTTPDRDPPRPIRHRPNGFRHRRLRQRRVVRRRQRGAAGGHRAARPDVAARRRPHRVDRASCFLADDTVICGGKRIPVSELNAAAAARGMRLTEARKAYGSPRSVSANTQGMRVAVNRVTGEIRILYSVQALDPGVVINPAQVRGQVEGGVAQGIGFVLTENFHLDDTGTMLNPNLRNYRIPTYADIPRTEVLIVESTDSAGPMASKGIAESCINPVAPALANAVYDATGIRFRDLPLTPERIFERPGTCHDGR